MTTIGRYSKSGHDGGPPDHPGPCQPWHYCDWCPCPHDHPDWPHQGHQHERVVKVAQRRDRFVSAAPGHADGRAM